MIILLTGATGTLGSQVLFSLLEERFSSIEKLYLPVREKKMVSPEKRISNMLESDYAPKFIKDNLTAILAKIEVISAKNLLKPKLFLKGEKISHFIHLAGFVNLSTLPEAKVEIFKENFEFTKAIFENYTPYIKNFTYISTAFSVGDVGGLIPNDYLQMEPEAHRNYYEASKFASEQFLKEAGASKNIPVQILRPSVLGGNMINEPSFFISKYMVFYLFAKFFHNTTIRDTIRITASTTSGLNIIPTDYAARVIVKVFDSPIKQLNIVHSKTTHVTRGISRILETVNFKNFKLTPNKIDATTGFESKLEKFYYDTIGVHITPYLTSKPCEWDTTELEKILPIPKYNLEEYLGNTITFAKTNGFRNQKW